MNLSFLDEIFKPIGSGLADVDKFVDREMPFDSGWGLPAALVAAYFAPQLIPALAEGGGAAGGAAGIGAAEGTGAAASSGGMNSLLSGLGLEGGAFGGELFQLGGSAGAEGSIGAGGMNSLLSNFGLDAGSFAGQEAFSLPSSAYTPEYLDMLAKSQGVDAGNVSFLDRLMGNTEQGLYKQEGLAKQASGQTMQDMLRKQAQQKALSQLTQSGSNMQQQNTAQQAEQNRMAQLQAMMRKGQAVDTTTALLSLLQDREQSRQPRISLI
jgi:hypothetical protein